MKDNNNIYLKNMQNLRENKKITQVKLAILTGVSQQSITYYETGTRIPSLPVALKISKVLNTSIEGLIDENSISNKYYALEKKDRETINQLIESLYNKNIK